MPRKKSSSKKQQAKQPDTGAAVAARSSSVNFQPVISIIERSNIVRSESI